ncbi:hypothetical protein PRUPE_7G151400 [Prunus persica]|uniref:Protein kinase domain-containing protein n=1 Tax=Prunus persica TaxID=3760 RepID=A0A251NBS4_PRUPE|nr:hypothetical protein PRUPE_7G151400 [Prunus persica]
METIYCPVTQVIIQDPKLFQNKQSRLLTDYDEIKALGSGAFGVVVSCKSKIDETSYAVKKIAIGDEEEFKFDRVRREVLIMSQLQHPYIVRYHTVWLEPFLAGLNNIADDDDEGNSSVSNINLPHLYIQMELCDSTLKDIFESDKIMTEPLCWRIFGDVMNGLTYMHAQGIMHGDLSPANIFRCGDVWKIGDFGLVFIFFFAARNVNDENDDKVIKSLNMKGTYKAPDENVDCAVDIYSAGILLFVMILKMKLITDMEMVVAIADLKNRGELPEEWNNYPRWQLVLKLVQRRPDLRPSARDLSTIVIAYSQ